MRLSRFIGIIALLFILTIRPAPTSSAPVEQLLPINQIRLPHGFKITQYATGIPQARMMTLGTNGTLFIGTHASR
ncbi:MAG: sorbosone dehydrogenase family protein, partial [Anaerolineae bacterium]|nr:sorbosone dehydrogenase family protein [Anaerolineae bacterium]